ncbi:transglycosylase domain-containing protein [Aliiruegeria lutimaris]|uniref:peptidoglycan glycosyltransferase n=1 Tax=Aliiruegeria lutimaris TaxID=571298 RepID=A0A1G9DGN4_9RHOB|nr:transglycosylase domain-containing protein [Aliiruegeria lutimaris]SDK63023.1 Penicillin binding protein transpeptidase domain-containing protein [Aliiruegeria lutimaris]
MSSTGGKRPTLRADKRYPSGGSGKSPVKKSTPKKSAPKAASVKRSRRKTTARKSTRTPRRGVFGWIRGAIGFVLGLIWSIIWRSSVVLGLILAGAVLYFYAQLPPFTEQIDGRTRGSVTLLDRNGEVFAWRGEQFESITDIGQISRHAKNAVVATEDRRFYWHMGISPRGIASAVRINLSEGRSALSGHGGSTLTQQTAKLLCLGVPYDPATGMNEGEYEADCRRTTIGRKLKEAVYSMAMELKYTKDEILVIYFNRAYLGASARGFEAASQRYFGVPASQLAPGQAAMLAGLLKAPTRYAPTNNLKRSQDRADTVIKLMYDQGYLTEAERDHAWANPATLSEAAQAHAGGYFADWVMDTGPNYLTRDTTEDVILRTTLDQGIQRSAEEALQFIFQEKVRDGSEAQAAIVVMSADGAVRAMVGGRETRVSGAFNRATMAKRQTGSSFKPFVYAAALDLGYTPLATVVDEPYCISLPGQPNYCPKNYSREFKGRVTLTKALADSLNIPAVKVSEAVGRENVRKIASDFGIDNELAVGPALALGVSESTLLEMSGAYAGILNGGRSVTPYGLMELRLEGESEPLMGQGGGFGERVISDTAARNLVYMMNQVVEAGTGQRAKLGERPAAGKTGTTQAARDAWFIGFTADYVTGVWMGYDDNTPLSGVTGGGLPTEIWHEAMVRIHEGKPINPLPMDIPQNAAQPDPHSEGAPGTAQSSNTRAPQPKKDNLAERILRDVGSIFGRRN